MPVIEYAHANGACDVQGGYVYRGSVVTQLTGRYLYADYCAGFVRSFTFSGGAATSSRDWPQLALAAAVASSHSAKTRAASCTS